MKKTIEIDEDEIIIAIRKPEGYEDVIDEITAGDAMERCDFEWRLVE